MNVVSERLNCRARPCICSSSRPEPSSKTHRGLPENGSPARAKTLSRRKGSLMGPLSQTRLPPRARATPRPGPRVGRVSIQSPEPVVHPEGRLVLLRHGETEWSRTGQHTGTTDVPLTPAGEQAARSLAGALDGYRFSLVLTSPLQRARRTAEL